MADDPIYTEADLAAHVEAERVRAERVATDYAGSARGSKADLASRNTGAVSCLICAEAAGQSIAKEIRALGPTPAYDAALAAARLEGMETAVAACEAQRKLFQSHQYATPQPIGSLMECFAVDECIKAIRAAAGAGE